MSIRFSVLGALALLGSISVAQASSEPSTDSLRDSLLLNSGGQLIERSQASASYILLRAERGALLLSDDANRDPLLRALSFLDRYGPLLGLSDTTDQLALQRVSVDRAGGRHVHLDQRQAGLPVFGARLVVHMNDFGITGVSGVFIPDLASLPTTAGLPTSELQDIARRLLAKDHPGASFAVESARLMFYRSGLLEGYVGHNYLAYEVMLRSLAGDLRERVILDAANGRVINRINEIHSLKNREIYTPNQDLPPVITEGAVNAPADPALSGDVGSDPATRAPRAPTDNLYIFAGGTYEMYRNLFGREGYDDGALPAEEQVQKSVYLINDACPNAYWNGDSTNYCPGFDADDIVSHEWSHAYTEYTHGLIYQYQSGALNESYSDIFGETYDLVNGLEGPLGVNLSEGDYYENGGSRWVIGEDLTEAASLALARDMWDPDSFGSVPGTTIPLLNGPSPGSVISSPNYYCGSGDGGGVHTNSGVPNHAYAMLVDGKAFNGVTIPAIGMTRAAHIYFHAMTHYQVPSTNFAQHADALAQSCQDLIGAGLNDVLGQPSADRIDAGTCAAVEAAMLATEMRESVQAKCNYQPLLQPESSTPALCAAGESPVAVFAEDWETGLIPAGWELSENITGDSSEDIRWEVVDSLPAPHQGHAAFIANSLGGSCAPGGDISASFRLDSPEIVLQDAASTLSLNHLMQSEFAYDGGNLKFSVNGGDFAIVPAEAFVHNAYNTSLETGAGAVPDPLGLISGGNTNPMAGEAAWSGSDEGESFSNWGTSLVDLAALGAAAGDRIRFRFEFGQDGCNGNLGWYLDDVTVSHCAVDAVASSDDADADPAGRSLDVRGGAPGGALLLLSLLLVWRRRR